MTDTEILDWLDRYHVEITRTTQDGQFILEYLCWTDGETFHAIQGQPGEAIREAVVRAEVFRQSQPG